MTPKIVSLYGYRGGNGKTTFALNIGYLLAKMGHSVLIVDADLHGGSVEDVLDKNITKRGTQTFVDFLLSKRKAARFESTISEVGFGEVAFDVALGNPGPRKLLMLLTVGDQKVQLIRNEMLRRALCETPKEYEFVIIDATPGFMVYTQLFLVGTDMVIHVLRDAAIDYLQSSKYTIPTLRGLKRRGHVKNYMLLVNEVTRNETDLKAMLEHYELDKEEQFGIVKFYDELRAPRTPVVFAAEKGFEDYSQAIEACVQRNLL